MTSVTSQPEAIASPPKPKTRRRVQGPFKKLGRPSLPAEIKRGRRITVRVSPADSRWLDEMGSKLGCPRGRVIAMMIRAQHHAPEPPAPKKRRAEAK